MKIGPLEVIWHGSAARRERKALSALEKDIRDLLVRNREKNYIEAIKLHRTRTGSTLKAAKDAVDRIREGI